jgi:glyoxylase I family protein
MAAAAEVIGLDHYCATFVDDPDGLRLEITNFRAERKERMEHWVTE